MIDRCPRCRRVSVVRDDGTLMPHMRPSVGGSHTVGPVRWIWCLPRAAQAVERGGGHGGGRSA